VARDLYRVLGVERTATEGDIKRAYRKLARELHPDVTGDDPRATERFKEISVAYETLSDPQRRRSYDLFGSKDAPPPPGPGVYLDLDSLLDQVFPSRKKKPRPEPGVDVEKSITVSFVDAFSGCTALVDTLSVVVPAGVVDGARLRVKGRGGRGHDGGPDGDLYVVVRIAPDPHFRRDGDDVLMTVPVPLRTALLGGHVELALPDGTARLRVPPTTQGGRVFRLRGKGFLRKSGQRGDILATTHVEVPTVPTTLTAEVDDLLRRLGA
jgi:curved DNA-binding protein